jgi:hypothetical protein
MTATTADSRSDSTRGDDMANTVGPAGQGSDNGHLGTVDASLARENGGKASTWHGRRFGHAAVNVMAARIIRTWRRCGDLAELGQWLAPIEDALAAAPAAGSRQLRAALADAHEDSAEALYLANPCPDTARHLLRSRAADRLASLDHDREIAQRFGLDL